MSTFRDSRDSRDFGDFGDFRDAGVQFGLEARARAAVLATADEIRADDVPPVPAWLAESSAAAGRRDGRDERNDGSGFRFGSGFGFGGSWQRAGRWTGRWGYRSRPPRRSPWRPA